MHARSLLTRIALGLAAALMTLPSMASPPVQDYQIETLAGNGEPGDIPNGRGEAQKVPIDLPFGVENGPDGSLYIASVGMHRVLRLDQKTGLLTSVVGNGRRGYAGDGGPASQAMLNEPYEVRYNIIRAIDTVHGTIRTIAGAGREQHEFAGDGILATRAPLWQPHGVYISENGSLIMSDTRNHRVRLLSPFPPAR